MLTILTALISRKAQSEGEGIDRDPGIVSLLSAMVRSARRGAASAVAALRGSHQRANENESFSSSNAWPYNHRSN